MTAGKWFRIAAAAAASVIVMVCGVFAADASASSVDPETKGSISVSMKAGGDLNLFKVADVIPDKGYAFELTSEFSGIENASNAEIAKNMAKYASDKSVKAVATLKASEDSVLKFSDLTAGLYLITQTNAAEGYSVMDPFLISIPGSASSQDPYNVNASPKMELKKESTPPPKDDTPPTGSRLPQTGQLWWPVAVLLAAGVLMLAAGVLRRRSGN